MFLLVSSRHVGTHTDGHQHGVSIQISINLGKIFLHISRIRKIAVTRILARNFAYLLSFISRFWTLSIDRFWFLFWSILNCVTLKTNNKRVVRQARENKFDLVYHSVHTPPHCNWLASSNLTLKKCLVTSMQMLPSSFFLQFEKMDICTYAGNEK